MKKITINRKTNLSLIIKREIRKSVGAHNNCPVLIVNGSLPPRMCGHSFYYENKSGDIIRYPNAYKKAWGKPIYISSTKRVEVGSEWLLNKLSLETLRLHKLRAFS
jgi:hypothetical protein